MRNLHRIEKDLIPLYGEDCPVIVAFRVGWPDQSFLHGTLGDIKAKVRAAKLTRTALIFVGRPLPQRSSAIQPSMTQTMSTSSGPGARKPDPRRQVRSDTHANAWSTLVTVATASPGCPAGGAIMRTGKDSIRAASILP